MENKSKSEKDLVKLGLMNQLKRLMDNWAEIYKRDKKITKDNFEEVISGAREITTHLKKLELLCNPPINELNVSLLNWTREKKDQYEKLAFDIEVRWKKMSNLNDELLMVRIDNEKGKGCLFIIFESAKDRETAEQQVDLFYNLYKKLASYTDEFGNCDVVSLLNYLEKTRNWFPYPFTYVFIPEKIIGSEGEEEYLLRETLGKKLNSEKLRKAYSLKETKKLNSFPVFRLRIKGKNSDEEKVEKGYFFADPNYYEEIKEREKLYAG